LAKITGDDLLQIILVFFERMGFELKKFHFKDSSQKLRIATKIVDELNVNFQYFYFFYKFPDRKATVSALIVMPY